jgi:hypothetical protein
MPIKVDAKPLTSYAAESGHWYNRDGSTAYRIVGANGKERATTIRDARKHGLVPSVTTILKAAAKPGLERWKAEQLLMSALTLPRLTAESERDWIGRVWEDSIQQSIKAAERGTDIHAAIEAWAKGQVLSDELQPFAEAALDAIEPLRPQDWKSEKSFACPLGYGGKVDLHSPEYVIDFKTKDGDLAELKCFDEHFMQVAAYAYGLGVPSARCGIVFVNRQLPAQARLVMHTSEETVHGWAMFLALLRYWQEANEYAPVWKEAI